MSRYINLFIYGFTFSCKVIGPVTRSGRENNISSGMCKVTHHHQLLTRYTFYQ